MCGGGVTAEICNPERSVPAPDSWNNSNCVLSQTKRILTHLHGCKFHREHWILTVTNLKVCLLYYGVARSKKIESDTDIRKTKNLSTNLRFCGKRKDCTRQLTSILKLWCSDDYKFLFTISHVWEIETQAPVSVWIAVFYSAYLSTTNLIPSGDVNFFHQSLTSRGTSSSLHWRNSGFGNEISSLGCSLGWPPYVFGYLPL